MKALIDRAGFCPDGTISCLNARWALQIVAVRRAGAIHVFDTMNHLFLSSQMIVPGSNYWNIGIGRDKGEVEKDEEGIQTMKILGQNMAWLLKNLQRITERKAKRGRDKSFLRPLSIDEAVWFDHFFLTNIAPVFFVERLADIEKSVRTGRDPISPGGGTL